MELVIATYNPGKFAELRSGLEVLGIPLLSLNDFANIPEAPETGETFSVIAHNKAKYYFDRLNERRHSAGISERRLSAGVLAEDSGLVIPSLEGYPGIFSARVGKTDEERIRVVLDKLHSTQDRSAYYHCSMVFITTTGEIETEGRCYGTIAKTPSGNLGFGYDPIFVPQNDFTTENTESTEISSSIFSVSSVPSVVKKSNRTFGETPLSEKAAISHRGRALQEMIPRIRKNWNL